MNKKEIYTSYTCKSTMHFQEVAAAYHQQFVEGALGVCVAFSVPVRIKREKSSKRQQVTSREEPQPKLSPAIMMGYLVDMDPSSTVVLRRGGRNDGPVVIGRHSGVQEK